MKHLFSGAHKTSPCSNQRAEIALSKGEAGGCLTWRLYTSAISTSGKLYTEILVGELVGVFNSLEVLHSPNISSLKVRDSTQ